MKKNLTQPVIYPVNRDLTKQWFIKYPNPSGGTPLKSYGKLNKLPTVEDRLAEAYRMIRDEIKWVYNPDISGLLIDDLIAVINKFHNYRCIGLKEKSRHCYDSQVFELVRFLRFDWKGDDISLMGLDFISHLKKLKKSHTTINNYRVNLGAIFRNAVKAKKISINPFENTSKLPERRLTKEWFRQEQIDTLAEHIKKVDPQLWLACRMQFYCFIRPVCELQHLKIKDIDLSERRFVIRAEFSKNGSVDEYVKIPDALLPEMVELKNYPRDYYIFGIYGQPGPKKVYRDHMTKDFTAILKELQFPKGYTFYSWKNTGAVHMIKAGISILHISKMMRHSSLDYTKEYFKSLGFEDLHDDIDKLMPVI